MEHKMHPVGRMQNSKCGTYWYMK